MLTKTAVLPEAGTGNRPITALTVRRLQKFRFNVIILDANLLHSRGFVNRIFCRPMRKSKNYK